MLVYGGGMNMFGMKQVKELQKMNTIIGMETVLFGNILCHGSLRIEGNIIGDLKVDGDVYIGDSAIITGNITANNVTLGGIVEGKITAEGILRLLSTAKLNGDINVGGFIADSGGIFIGKCYLDKPPRKVLEAMFTEKRDKDLSVVRLAINE